MAVPLQPSVTQADLRQKISRVMHALQSLWDEPNPGIHEDRLLDLIMICLTFRDPNSADRLSTVVELMAASGNGRGKLAQAVVGLADDSVELALVKAILNGDSWEDVAVLVVKAARTENGSSSSATAPATASSQPASTSPTPAGPQALLAQMQGGGSGSTSSPQPPADASATTVLPAQPAANAGAGNDDTSSHGPRRPRRL